MNNFSKRTLLLTCLATSISLLSACGGGGGGGDGKLPRNTGDGKQTGSTTHQNFDQEPNNFDNPIELSSMVNLEGTVNNESDQEDAYLFTAPQSGAYSINLSGFGNHDLDLYFVEGDTGDIMFEGENDPGVEESGVVNLVSGETYGVAVYAYDTKGSTVPYQFTISTQNTNGGNNGGNNGGGNNGGGNNGGGTTSGDNEPNNTLDNADPLSPDNTVYGTVNNADDDVDLFQLQFQVNTEYQVVLAGISSSAAELYLLTADGTSLGSGSLREDNTLVMDLSVTGDGQAPTLYVLVQATNTNNQPDDYQLTLKTL